jgi:hypothetical protein
MNSRGLNQGTSGNISARYKDVMLITPSAMPCDAIKPEMIAVMPLKGEYGSWDGPLNPAVKPTTMLEDALLDLTNRGDIVIDPFLGSGSTLIASEKIGRVCRGVELDPLYVDVIGRRYEAASGAPAVLIETGEAFDVLAARRAEQAVPI